jgi:hypothetical protein
MGEPLEIHMYGYVGERRTGGMQRMGGERGLPGGGGGGRKREREEKRSG